MPRREDSVQDIIEVGYFASFEYRSIAVESCPLAIYLSCCTLVNNSQPFRTCRDNTLRRTRVLYWIHIVPGSFPVVPDTSMRRA